jgi:spermidine synthase
MREMSKKHSKSVKAAPAAAASGYMPGGLSRESRRYLPVLLLLFAGSGCAALTYEIVWYQLLELVIGSSAISLGVLLATFMGGLCVGSLAMPRLLATRKEHPLRVYAKIEFGIAVCGVLVLFGMPLLDGVYAAAVGHGMPAMLLRAVLCAMLLLPPTILMGASLPAAARWLEASREGVSWMGLLYAANTGGAVVGCALAGFYLLREFDMTTATCAAVALNVGAGLISLMLAGRTPQRATAGESIPNRPAGEPRYWPVYVAIALSGATALGAEAIWTRILSLLLGATVYTFSIILAVFLVGLGLGSGAGSLLVRSVKPRHALGMCQMLLVAALAWTAFMLGKSLPYWPIIPAYSTSFWLTFQIDLVRCVWAVLPATILWGASFPLALAAAAPRAQDSDHLVGGIYAANTAGAIAGALCFSTILVPWIGLAGCERVLIVLAGISGLFVLARMVVQSRAVAGALGLAAALATTGVLAAHVPGIPPMLIAYGRHILTARSHASILFAGDGMNSSIAVSKWESGTILFHVSGKVEASTEPVDMRLQRMLGHLPALIHPNPRSVLIVGFGAGVTAGSFALYPGIQRIVICEIEPLIPPTATKYFGKENYGVTKDPRVEIVYDDARHFVLTTREKFDIISSDPIHPWVKGSAALYTKEYFSLVRQHLNPGGVVSQWVPMYDTNMRAVKSELATFFDVFPNGTLWGNANYSEYDTVVLGQTVPQSIDVAAMQRRLDRPDHSAVARSLQQVGFGSVVALLSTYGGQEPELRTWLAGAELNRDGNLRLQYLAGLAMDASMEQGIYSDLLRYRRFPPNLFVGPDDRLKELWTSIRKASGQ